MALVILTLLFLSLFFYISFSFFFSLFFLPLLLSERESAVLIYASGYTGCAAILQPARMSRSEPLERLEPRFFSFFLLASLDSPFFFFFLLWCYSVCTSMLYFLLPSLSATLSSSSSSLSLYLYLSISLPRSTSLSSLYRSPSPPS